MSDKSELRKRAKDLRADIQHGRRKQAKEAATKELKELLNGSYPVLSFASFGSEIDLWELNNYLAQSGRLFLPKVDGQQLSIYKVSDLEKDLLPSKWGVLEPDPERCTQAFVITTALVPGLTFDSHHHRLGYGKGLYDRLLEQLPAANKWGIGFKEQFLSSLPTDPHDQKLDSLYLY